MKVLVIFFMFFAIQSCRHRFKVTVFKNKNIEISQGIPTDLFYFKQKDSTLFVVTLLDYQNGIAQKTAPIVFTIPHRSNQIVPLKNSLEKKLLHPRQVTIKDLNIDGSPEILIADHGQDSPPFPGAKPSLYSFVNEKINDISHLLEAVPIGFYFYSEIADFNNDGFRDIFLSHLDDSNSKVKSNIYLYKNGKYLPNRESPFIDNHLAALSIDANHDGLLDVFLGRAEEFSLNGIGGKDQIWLNNGDGNFTNSSDFLPKRVYPTWGTASAIKADVNGDSIDDVITSQYNNGFSKGLIQIYYGKKGAEFTTESFPFSPKEISYPFFIPWVSVDNFSGDKSKDILFLVRDSSKNGVPKRGHLFRYYEQENEKFIDRTDEIGLKDIPFVAGFIIDIDGDGNNEILLFDYSLNRYLVHNI